MDDETPINKDDAATKRKRRLPGAVESAGFALQERVIWPLQDRFGPPGPGPNRKLLLGGGAAAVVVAGVATALALSGGGSSTPPSTAAQTTSPREPLAAVSEPTEPKPQAKQEPPRETLHGATPVFSPPSPASKGGEKTGGSKAAAADSTAGAQGGADASTEASAGEESDANAASSTEGDSTSSPAAARISSDPESSAANDDPTAGTAAARAAVADGPPAGPAGLKVAREFAKGFVVYETGGEKSAFEDAFAASATPELAKALLERPPKQPAGVKVPRAKVLNVVAGPSRGNVYKVSVSLLRVGVTSELRLDLEKAQKGKRVEWRVTNVLG